MRIYTRTTKGNALALNPQLPLSRSLRRLLIAIDGRVETYANRIAAFENVDIALALLVRDGLIRVSSEERANAVGINQLSEPDFVDTDPDFMAIDHAHDPLGTASNLLEETASETHASDADELSSWVGFRASVPIASSFPMYPRTAQAGHRTSSPNIAQHQLQDAISLISDFAERYLADKSLEVILTFESLSSVEQILGQLKDYQALIAPLGEPARNHLARLRKVLTTA